MIYFYFYEHENQTEGRRAIEKSMSDFREEDIRRYSAKKMF